MATIENSTGPRARGLLPFAFRARPMARPVDHRSAAELPAPPLLSVSAEIRPSDCKGLARHRGAGTAGGRPGEMAAALLPRGEAFDLPEAGEISAARARARHARAALEQAVQHGVDLLSALGIDAPALGHPLDAAIWALDALDADPDSEDDGTAEEEPDDEDCADAEACLGAPEHHADQTLWGQGGHLDIEHDDSDMEASGEDGSARVTLTRQAQVVRRMIPAPGINCAPNYPARAGALFWLGPAV